MTRSRRYAHKHPMCLWPALILILFAMVFLGCDGGDDPPPVDDETTSVYTVETQDRVELKMRRYRPAPDAPFNEGGQPVLMLPGVGMNMNEFLPRTTDHMKDVYSKMQLPANLPAWALGDDYIQQDHLLLYNLGHYLWLQGYDPWFGNDRGTGRDPYKSGTGINPTNLDVYGCLDVPAMVDKVIEVTGKKVIIGGHSTGGVASYIYLQGAYITQII